MKTNGIQVSLSTILQTVAAIVLSYMLNQVLGMEAKVRALEVKAEAQAKEMDQQAASIRSLWEKKQAKENK